MCLYKYGEEIPNGYWFRTAWIKYIIKENPYISDETLSIFSYGKTPDRE